VFASMPSRLSGAIYQPRLLVLVGSDAWRALSPWPRVGKSAGVESGPSSAPRLVPADAFSKLVVGRPLRARRPPFDSDRQPLGLTAAVEDDWSRLSRGRTFLF
jgi:hypothetical protein